jgi:hypothetical protein
MRNLALLLLLLLASLALAGAARALPLPPASQPVTLVGVAEEDESDDEPDGAEEIEAEDAEEGDEADESDSCEPDEDEGCEEEADDPGCVIESAHVAVAASPGHGRVRLLIHYTASSPATFTLDYSLHGGKGGLHLGSARAHLHRAGVFHDFVSVDPKRMAKVLAARQFAVDLHAVGTPGYCRERLTVQRRSARKPRWS